MKKNITLRLDAKQRVCLTRLLSDMPVSSFRAHREKDKIILEPLIEIPASELNELWLYKNPKAMKSVMKGLDQSEKGELEEVNTDFSTFIDEDI